MRQRLHQSAAASLRSVPMTSVTDRQRAIVIPHCSNVHGTDELHRRSMRPLDHVLGPQIRTFLSRRPRSYHRFRPPQPSGAGCLARRPAHAWAATGVHLYRPLNQQLSSRPQMRAGHAGKGILNTSRLGQTDQIAPEQSRLRADARWAWLRA